MSYVASRGLVALGWVGSMLGAAFTQAGTVVQFDTSLGSFEVELFDDDAPLHVANFLAYVNAGDYDGTVIHRSAPGFVIQGGRFDVDAGELGEIPSRGNVQNEPGVSNTRGTLAAAKLGGDPDSASREWFFNLADNSANLDNQNGGFTVFGQILGNVGLSIIDLIADLPVVDVSGSVPAFTDLPVQNYTSGDPVGVANLFLIDSIDVVNNTPAVPTVPPAPTEPEEPITPPTPDPVEPFEPSEPLVPGDNESPVDPGSPQTPESPTDIDQPTVIPTPSAVLAGLAGLSLLASRRRR